MFLVPEARGRRLGPDAAGAVVRYLFQEGWTEVTVDPLLDNEGAIRAWARAGFVADHHDTDEQTGNPASSWSSVDRNGPRRTASEEPLPAPGQP
jgi:RimJ/RimL family protein N-acetyltransferase